MRQQAREEARRIRQAAQNEEAQFVQGLGHKLHREWAEEKENLIQQLQQECNDCIQKLGEAHEQAIKQVILHVHYTDIFFNF